MARGVGKPGPPNGDDLYKMLSPGEKSRLTQYNRRSSAEYDPYAYARAVHEVKVQNLFGAIPLASSRGEFNGRPMDEVVPTMGFDFDDRKAPVMEWYDYDDEGFDYNNQAQDVLEDESAAPITLVPTSTINWARPRTVAAGYDKDQQKLTVIFRDGTYYNYFQVDNRVWQNFKRARSKGRYILAHLDGLPRGRASVSTLPDDSRAIVYRFLKAGQEIRGGLQPGQTAKGRKGGYGSGNLGGTGRARQKKQNPKP